jgi:hypothetical protein
MTIAVDLDALIEAFEDASPALNYYVDRETGEVILVSETLGFIEAGQQRAEMAEQPGRYIAIPAAGTTELTDDLESFIDSIEDETVQAALEDALDAPDVAAGLTKALAKREAVAEAWSRYRHDRFRDRALRWLEANGFDANRVLPYAR